VRLQGDVQLGTKVEIKNLNSIRFIKKAIEHEKERLIGLHSAGKKIVQETRGFDEASGTTYSIRVKEDEDDYRYFPEPDLPPFLVSDDTIRSIRESMPPLPEAVRKDLIAHYALSEYDAALIANDLELTRIFGELTARGIAAKPAANWTIGPVKNALSESDEVSIPIQGLSKIIAMVQDEIISHGVATQKVFPELLSHPGLDISDFIAGEGLSRQAGLSGIDDLIDASLKKHSQKITEYKKGKKGLLGLFVGEVMKLSHGKADAKVVTEKIIEKLNAS
jgi:aspartyl-tRNA(Asn)/glutamyl-tRNA(Gln) amidotransferase subunit B